MTGGRARPARRDDHTSAPRVTVSTERVASNARRAPRPRSAGENYPRTVPRRPRVLVVDRDPGIGDAVGRAFPGCDVEKHLDVARARAAMLGGDHVAWLVAVDAQDAMPLEFLAQARRDGRHTPTLLTSTRGSCVIVNRAQLLGVEFLRKPYCADNVRAFVTRALETAHGSLEAVAARLAASTNLSRRETELLRLIALGTRRAEFAGELGVSENTIKTTLRHLLRKTRCESVDDLRCVVLRHAQRARSISLGPEPSSRSSPDTDAAIRLIGPHATSTSFRNGALVVPKL